MKRLQTFTNTEFGQIRTIDINEKTYAVGNDVAKSLGYARPYEAVTAHCKGAVSYRVLTEGGEQEVKVIPEGDIYRLIVKAADQSKNPAIKEKAERYERWVFDEVLPSIRKHGMYAKDELLDNPDLLLEVVSKLKEERDKRIAAETKALVLEQRVAEYEPKITYLDQILQSKDTVTITQIAKDYGMSGQKLNQILNEEGVQYKQNGQWLLYRKYHDKGYTKSYTVDVVHTNGQQTVKMNTRWTQKGRLFIHDVLTRRGFVAMIDRRDIGA